MKLRLLLLISVACAIQAQEVVQNKPTTPPRQTPVGDLSLHNAPLTDVIDMFARQLGLNVLVDPRVKGIVTLNISGEARRLDARYVLDMLLHSNGAGMVEDGGLFHIVPLTEIGHQAVPVWVSNFPSDPTLGVDMGGGFRGCAAGDNSPAGTILSGYRKVVARNLMGTSCHWEQVK